MSIACQVPPLLLSEPCPGSRLEEINSHRFCPTAYHWDTSDWMPGARLSDIEEVPNYENQEGGSAHQGSTRELESDYYLGGYDIDSEYPPDRKSVV